MTRSRKDASLRREEILRATTALIEKEGIQALRISDVAQSLQVSPALVVYHFRTKEELIAEAFTWAAQRDLDRLEKLTAAAPSAVGRLGTALAWYAPTGQAKGWKLWIEGWAAALREPTLRQVGREVDLRWKESLTAVIQDGVGTGEFTCADARGAAWRITAVLDGLAVQALVHQGVQSRERMDEWARQIVGREVGVDPAVLERPAGA
ncbi:TetR family transcriptional regulator [Streptacidiphilus pinicola]|uniref:TetR family transcriptional regulator n=1 Tax=Streptacidiphilus pinicola TaxID=2219663 RepID=A0A2X0K420_9ACTN|nr:TetR/AcrR family transcriptional regulator [Streptacidiphilus pinicola]RAG83995.1 TetR family transcriptional regulator [Streptacidiphilus pinicola]